MKTTTRKPTLRKDILFLNAHRVTDHTEVPRGRDYNYNCWGFTRGLIETSDYYWEHIYDMERWLKHHTKKLGVKDIPTPGDILVFRGKDEENCCCDNEESCNCEPELLHTALFLLFDCNDMVILHKPGGRPLERSTLHECEEANPYYGKMTEIRRYKRP